MMQHLVVIANNYPSPGTPYYGTFVRELARGVVRLGKDCSVIAPVPRHKRRKAERFPEHEVDDSAGRPIQVYRPRYLSLSGWDALGFLGACSPNRFSYLRFERAVQRTICRQGIAADAVYGHFLYFSGAAAVRVGTRLGLPAFACAGEGELATVRRMGQATARRDLSPASGLVAVNSSLAQRLRDELGLRTQPLAVIPNGTDLTRFYPRDRAAARRHFGLPQDLFLVASVGSFFYKKGIVRVGQAINGLPGVAGVFAGSGPQPPQASNVALCRNVSHEEIPLLLSACDLFVLPTMIEGSCNALIEAMACGLPIVSSVGRFNDDLLDDSMSIRVDPLDVLAIRQAIVRLQQDGELRARMSECAQRKSLAFDINQRTRKVVQFMEQHTRPAQANPSAT